MSTTKAVKAESSEELTFKDYFASIFNQPEHSDFTIVCPPECDATTPTVFYVKKAVLCRIKWFRKACLGHFAESRTKTIELPETTPASKTRNLDNQYDRRYEDHQILLPHHKLVLCRIEWFRKACSSPFLERNSNTINFPKDKAAVVEILLKHIYGVEGAVSVSPITFDTLIDLYLLADRLNIPSLVAGIQQVVKMHLNEQLARDAYDIEMWEVIARVFCLHSEGFTTLQNIIVGVLLSEHKTQLVREPEILKESLLLVPGLLTTLAVQGIKVGSVAGKGSQLESRARQQQSSQDLFDQAITTEFTATNSATAFDTITQEGNEAMVSLNVSIQAPLGFGAGVVGERADQ